MLLRDKSAGRSLIMRIQSIVMTTLNIVLWGTYSQQYLSSSSLISLPPSELLSRLDRLLSLMSKEYMI